MSHPSAVLELNGPQVLQVMKRPQVPLVQETVRVVTTQLGNLNWRQNVQEFCNYYRQDIPNAAGLDAELNLWERMWRDQQARQADIPDRISDTLKLVDKEAFVNIFNILQILATVPISSSFCERSISTLRNLKNCLRNTMGQERLNGLALMHSHRDMNFDMNSIVDLFANLHPRRMRMANILQEGESNG